MSQHFNQDYFKVAGTEYGSGSNAKIYKAQFTENRANLRGDRSADRKPSRASRKGAGEPSLPGTSAKKGAKKHLRAEAHQAKVKHKDDDAPVAVVEDVSSADMRTGKKRRSSKKKHQVEARIRHHEEEIGQYEPAPAATEAAAHGPSTLPPMAQDLIGKAKHLAGEAVEAARDVREHPSHLPRFIRTIGRSFRDAAKIAQAAAREFAKGATSKQTPQRT